MTVKISAEQSGTERQNEIAHEAGTSRRDCYLIEVMPRGWAWAYQRLLNAGQEDRWFVRRIG